MKKTKYIIQIILVLSSISIAYSQDKQDENSFKKRVLEHTELDILTSYYYQDGNNASVSGGVGDEHLTDITPTIVVSIPLNDDDVLTIDAGVSAYTSASSSNLNPWDVSGASRSDDDDDDDDEYENNMNGVINPDPVGSPWVESSGASQADTWVNLSMAYSHSSDDRNKIWNVNASISTEYDYTSIGLGAGYTRLFNQKNTEVSIQTKAFLDSWNPVFPTEIVSYQETGGNLNSGFFEGVNILDQNGSIISKNGANVYSPLRNDLIDEEKRNTYSLSLGFSQIVSKNFQVSVFSDLVIQNGWLANPMQRVYFADRPNYYIGNATDITNYTDESNQGVFQLADDIERLPDSRLKLPIGLRANYFINEFLSLRSYYRYYWDDWGINSHTAQIEVPIKLGSYFTIYPSYRFYNQTAADYFAPYEQAFSTEEFYTSDYDLSKFNSNQFGFGVQYQDILSQGKFLGMHLKSFNLNYSYYDRSTGLTAGIVSFGAKFLFK